MAKAVVIVVALLVAGCPADDSDDYEFALVIDDAPGAILSFWGPSTSNLFAVGGDLGDPGEELILWHDGSTWYRMQADAPTLWWVHGFSPSDVWAVGERGTVVHYDGNQWTQERTGSPYTLWGIWGATPNDLWAVGGDVAHTVDSVILHYDGSSWQEVPGVGRANDMYFKIWGSSASDIWAVSERGVIMHYDGADWTESQSGNTMRLITVTGTGPSDVYAVGGVTESVLLHYDGSSWTRDDSIDVPGGLMGVWAAPADGPVYVAGFTGVMAIRDGADADWMTLPSVTPNCLHATWGDGAGTILGGGGNLLVGADVQGTIIGTGDIAGGPIVDM